MKIIVLNFSNYRVNLNIIWGHTLETSYTNDANVSCVKTFSWKNNTFKQHLQSHTAQKPYKCTYCENTFLQKYHLKLRLWMHTGEKTYPGERPHRCSYCDKAFLQKYHLRNQLRIHTAEKPQKPQPCSQFDQAFLQKSDFKYHLRKHTVKKPHKYGYCEKAFLQKYDLEIHNGGYSLGRTHISAAIVMRLSWEK